MQGIRPYSKKGVWSFIVGKVFLIRAAHNNQIKENEEMKYIILLNGKPIEEATPEERKALEEKAKKIFEKYLGLQYIGKRA